MLKAVCVVRKQLRIPLTTLRLRAGVKERLR